MYALCYYAGSAFGYHSISMGWYMDQLIRRVDPEHRSAGQFFQEEIAKPFGKYAPTSRDYVNLKEK